MNLLANSLGGEISRVRAVAGFGLRHARGLARVGIGCSLLLVALSAASFVPTAFGQGQAGAAVQGQSSSAANSAAKPQAAAAAQSSAQSSGQTSTQTSTRAATGTSAQNPADAAALSEPQMQDQSAPAAESLGEAARRARAQKGGAAKPKVYTDDSVTSLSGHGVSVVGDGNSGGGGASYSRNSGGGGGGAQGAAGRPETYWGGGANEIRRQMAACDQRISEIQDEIAKHGAVSVDPQSGAQAGVIFVEDRNAQIKQVESQKEGFERQLDELAEDGRKAGADSGWVR